MRRNIPVFVCVLAGALVFPSLAPACGKERWGIKTLADKDAARISEQPIPATVAELNTIAAPTRKDLPEDRRLGPELHTYIVKAYLVGFKREADEDFHIVLADMDDHRATMVVEMPAAGCVAEEYRQQMTALRDSWEKRFGKATAKYKDVHQHKIKVQFVGVGFFDFIHGQTGVAKNGFELHPVLAWEEFFASTVLPASPARAD